MTYPNTANGVLLILAIFINSVIPIIERIKGKDKSTMLGGGKRVSLLIDIQNCIKAQQSKGYEHWAKINNIKQMSKTINFISENLGSYASS